MSIEEKQALAAALLSRAGYREIEDGVWLAKSATLTGTVRSAVMLAKAVGHELPALLS